MNNSAEIIVVSGLPRSGTSLMMQMLDRGGIEILTDHQRTTDADNPQGYYEFEAVKNLGEDAGWISQARGKAVKIVSLLLYHLPPTEKYRVIFMERDLDEVLSSQETMLGRLNRNPPPREKIAEAYRVHLENLESWLKSQKNLQILRIRYCDLIQSPLAALVQIGPFLERSVDTNLMAAAVNPSLYRNRSKSDVLFLPEKSL